MTRTFENIPLTEAKMVLSKDIFSYEEVKNCFERSNEIIVITYSISNKYIGFDNDQTLDHLMRLEHPPKKLTFITNIPVGRRKDGKKNLDYYVERLSAVNFQYEIDVRFNLENHSKIIITDKIAYIGSANFSFNSKKNWEAGVITKNVSDIASIRKLANIVIDNSIKPDSKEYLEIKLEIAELAKRRYALFDAFDEIVASSKDFFDDQVTETINQATDYQKELYTLFNSKIVPCIPYFPITLKQEESINDCRRDIDYANTGILAILNLPASKIINDHICGNEVADIDSLLKVKYESELELYKGNLFFLMEICGIKLNEIMEILKPYRRGYSDIRSDYESIENKFLP